MIKWFLILFVIIVIEIALVQEAYEKGYGEGKAAGYIEAMKVKGEADGKSNKDDSV